MTTESLSRALPFATGIETDFPFRACGRWPKWFIMEQVCVLTYRAVGGLYIIEASDLAEAMKQARVWFDQYLRELVVDRAALAAALDKMLVEAKR